MATRGSHGLEADVWGLGCTLYTLLVGQPPFDSQQVRSTLTRVVLDDCSLPSHLSASARDLLSRMLQKNPTERISLMDILAHPFFTKRTLASTPIGHRFESIDSGHGTVSKASSLPNQTLER